MLYIISGKFRISYRYFVIQEFARTFFIMKLGSMKNIINQREEMKKKN